MKKKKTIFTLKKKLLFRVWATGHYMSNNRTLRPAPGLKRNPCRRIYLYVFSNSGKDDKNAAENRSKAERFAKHLRHVDDI